MKRPGNVNGRRSCAIPTARAISTEPMSGILTPYRVLDLTNERGLLCGQIFGDLGADVIKIEPPGGSSARRLGPFFKDRPDPEGSLYWWGFNRNKRGITLEVDSKDGRDLFLQLVKRA